MGSIFSSKGSGQGYSALDIDVSIKRATGTGAASRFGASPGRASVNITKPETIGQSIEGLGQGFLGLIGSVPLVGGVLKGAAETVGGAVGAVGTAIGSIRPVESGPSVGDVVSGIPGAAMDVISAPSKFVQRDIISEFTAQQLLSNDKSGVQDYYNIPQIKSMVQAGATVDEIADVIYEQGRTFGAKPDIVRDVAFGLLTDPLTWIPGGAIASGAAKAGGLAKAVKAGVVLGAKESEFMKLWQPVGQVYNAISGTLSGSARAFSSIVAGRAYNMLEMAFKPKNIQNATKALARISVGEEDAVLSTASELTSVTLGRTAKAGASALIEDQASLSVAGSVSDMQDTLVKLGSDAIAKAGPEDDKYTLVSNAIGDLLDVARITKPNQRELVINSVLGQVSPAKSSELLESQRKLEDFLRGTFQKRALGIESAKDAEDALALQGRLHGKSVTEAGARILIGGKQELIALVDQPDAARQFVRNALSYSLGRSSVQADQFFNELILPAIRARNVEDAIEYLEFVRMPAYGKLARDLANLRQTQTGIGSRVTLISQRTLSRARASELSDSIKLAESEAVAREAVKTGISQYDELFAAFGRIAIDDLDDASFKNLREDILKYLDQNSRAFAVDIQADEFVELSEELRAFWPRAEAVGYRLGIAPEDGIIKRWSTLQDKYGRYYQTQSFAPYADLVDTAFTNPQNLGSDLLTYKRNPLQSMVQYALSPRYGSLITAKATNKFVTETSKIGMNPQEARSVWQALNDLANEAQTLPRGLALEKQLGRNSSLAKKINGALTKEAKQRIASLAGIAEEDVWGEVFMAMMRAYAGRLDDIGIMPRFTSWIKMKIPQVAIVTDRIYPLSRFGELAPQFRYVQENIEPNFFRFTSGAGVREQRIAGLNVNDIRTRAIIGEFAAVREVGDAQTIFMVAGNHVAGRMSQKAPMFWDAIGRFARGEGSLGEIRLSVKQSIIDVESRKRRGMQAMIARGAALRAYRVMAEETPEDMANFIRFFGTDDPEKVMHIIGLDFIARTDPVAAQRLIDEGIDLTMVRQYTDRGYEPTQVAINAKKFREAGGELEEVADPEELKQFFDDFVDFEDVADDAGNVIDQNAFKSDVKELENLMEWQEPGKEWNNVKAILKIAVEEKVTIERARNILFSERYNPQLEAALDKAIKGLGKNPTKKELADARASVLKDFGRVETKDGGGSSGFDGKWWDEQAAGVDARIFAKRYMDEVAGRVKPVGPKPLSSYDKTSLGVVQAMEDYYGGSKVFTRDMLKTPKDFAIARRMYDEEIPWDEAARKIEKDRVDGLAEEIDEWNAVKNDPKLRKKFLERNESPEEFFSSDPDSRFYVLESKFTEALEESDDTFYPLFEEQAIDDFFEQMEFDMKQNKGWMKFPDPKEAYIKKLKENRDAGPAVNVLKDALNRYFMWDPKVQDSARWIISRDADGNISGFALTVSEKLRAGLGDDVADKLTVTHLGSFTRGQGTGSALLADAHRASKARGIEFYVLDPTDASKEFYKKLGFEVVDSEPFRMAYAKPPAEFLHRRVGAPDAEVESYRNIVAAFRKAAADEGERARRAIYFDPNRPWLERSLNHPLLALYPLSYMVGKVIPEFTRLLIATPFAKQLGGTRPFLGVEALRLTADATVAALQYDPDFRDAVAENPELWIAINWLLPYTPDNIGFGLSSTVRKLGVAKGMAGEGFDISRFTQEAFNQVTSAALPGTIRMTGAAIEDITGDVQLPSLEGAPDILDILQGKN